MRIKNRIVSYRWRFKDWFFENIARKLPRIPTRKPYYSGMSDICSRCHTNINIYAHNSGEGWAFFWDCEHQHISNFGDEFDASMITDWFPFLFGWATGKDLGRIGIEVI